jgi:hypothetical protein
MGVNVEAWFRNNFSLDEAWALPALLNERCLGDAVWIWDEDDDPRRNERWEFDISPSRMHEGECSLHGPGLILDLYPQVMSLWSLARWRGFLFYPELRSEVRKAAKRIAGVLGGPDIIWLPDWAMEEFDPAEASLESIRGHLEEKWGTSQPSLDSMDPEVLKAAEHSSPRVWFEARGFRACDGHDPEGNVVQFREVAVR